MDYGMLTEKTKREAFGIVGPETNRTLDNPCQMACEADLLASQGKHTEAAQMYACAAIASGDMAGELLKTPGAKPKTLRVRMNNAHWLWRRALEQSTQAGIVPGPILLKPVVRDAPQFYALSTLLTDLAGILKESNANTAEFLLRGLVDDLSSWGFGREQ